MLNVGASSPLNLHRKALQTKLNPSGSNSSRSVTGHRSFYSSNKSVTSDDHGAVDLEGGINHHPPSTPHNSSLVSLQTRDTSPSRDGYDRDPPTVLGIRLVSSGSERSCSRGRSGQQAHVNILSDSEGNPRSSAPSHKVRKVPNFRLGNPFLNASPEVRLTLSLAVAIEDAT